MNDSILRDAEDRVNTKECKHCQYFYMHLGKPKCMEMEKEVEECNVAQLIIKGK